jgi:hypothetical protein
MQDKKLNDISEEILDKIIAVAYKDASLKDRISIYFLAKKNLEAKRLLNEYRETAGNVKNVPLEECPDSVIKSLEIKTGEEKKSFVIKPAYAFVITILVISTLVFVLLNHNKEKEPVYTKAEVAQAEMQVKTSLAILNKVFKKTENLIEDDILRKRIGKPVQKSFSIINQVLIGG